MVRILNFFDRLLSRVPQSLALLLARIAVAVPFWYSGLTRWSGTPLFSRIGDNTIAFFQDPEFGLNIPYYGKVPFPYPMEFAWMTGIAEIVLPILLVIGLLTRLSAFFLFVMTIVIELTFPSAWATHVLWGALALAIVVFGPGRFSLDWAMGVRNRAYSRETRPYVHDNHAM